MSITIRSQRWGVLGLGVLFLSSPLAYADISGKVFRDFNGNGTFDTGSTFNEVGMAGIGVKAFDAANTQIATATSAADGTYTLSGLSSGANYRLEFSWSGSWLKAGAAGGTSVQFVQDGAANADLALNAVGEYSSPSDPRMLTSLFRAGTVSSQPSVQSFARSSLGLNANFENNTGAQGTGPIPGDDALANQVGSVWGIAWQASKQRAFAASFLKRHVGLKNGLGYVYVLDESSNPGTLAGSFNLQGVTPANGGGPIDLGSVCRDASCAADPGDAADYVLPSVGATPSVDLDAFFKVGSVGFGDAEMEQGVDRLWLVNAYQQALISVDVSADDVGALPADVRQYPIASLPGAPTCTGGNLRPWALKFRDGKGYLGVTCDAFNSRQQADLKSVVVSFDPANISAGFSNVLNLPLNYTRTIPYFPFYPWMNQADVNTGWIMKDVNGAAAYPQPLLSDIEFDDAGNIYLAVMDLFVHQVGHFQYKPFSGGGDGKLIDGMTTGDFLKACKVGSGFEFEGSANCPAKIANSSGPNGGGQFFEDSAGDGRGESANGALAYLPGSNQINAVTMDPHPVGQTGDAYISTQGVSTYDLTTGKPVSWYSLVYGGEDPTYFGKGNGIGDIELLLESAPVEIGNRVWLDSDGDGIQDAGEAGIPDVQVQLLSGSTVLASATTAADGTYYFSSATGTDSGSKKYGLTQLQPNTAYTVRFPTALTVAGTAYGLSTAKAGNNSLIDSDAAASGDVAVAATDIPMAGANNHSFDVGYAPVTVDMALTKSVEPAAAKRGETVVYTLTVTNAGPSTATGVKVTDKLPDDGLIFVSHDGVTPDVYDAITGEWNVGTVEVGAANAVTLKVTATVK